MNLFSVELGPEVANIVCDCCGNPFKSVCGFIKKNNWAHSIYFASLQTGHSEIKVGLTISIGKFWKDSADQNPSWVFLTVVPNAEKWTMTVEPPEASRHFGSESLGKPLSLDKLRNDPVFDDFTAVAHFILDNDPAVTSYLSGKDVNILGRVCKH